MNGRRRIAVQNPAYKVAVTGVHFLDYNLTMLQKPETSQQIGTGPGVRQAKYRDHILMALTSKKERVLLYTADVGIGRAVELPVDHKGDFLGWVPRNEVTFL